MKIFPALIILSCKNDREIHEKIMITFVGDIDKMENFYEALEQKTVHFSDKNITTFIHREMEYHQSSRIAFMVEYMSNGKDFTWCDDILTANYNIEEAYCCVSEGKIKEYTCIWNAGREFEGCPLKRKPKTLELLQSSDFIERSL